MIGKRAYPTLSSSPLMISVEGMLILGCNMISLQWKEEYGFSKDSFSKIMSHANPNHSIQDEWHIITTWHPNQKMAEGYVQFWIIHMVSLVDTTQFSQLLLENVIWKVFLQQVTSWICMFSQHGKVSINVYQLYIDKITINLPKVMYRWATIIIKIGPKVTMKPKNTLALLWSNALLIYGEKIQILNGVINKYIN